MTRGAITDAAFFDPDTEGLAELAVATGGMAVNRPDSLTTYAAGTTYYFRMYWSCDSGTSYFLHTDSYYLFWLEEVMR